MSYKSRINRLKRIQLVLVIVCVLAIAVYGFIITRPEITSYVVKDECGPIGGTISHPIDDEDACSNACRAYCLSLEKKFHDSDFKLRFDECNSCNCECEE